MKISTDGVDTFYHIIDEIELPVQDCFVRWFKIGAGHGEGKFYVDSSKETMEHFFGFTHIVEENVQDYEAQKRNSFFMKDDIVQYLSAMTSEINNPRLPYHTELDKNGHEKQTVRQRIELLKSEESRNKLLNELKNIETFTVKPKHLVHAGAYVASGEESSNSKKLSALNGMQKLRTFLFPIISSMHIYKLEKDDDNSISFYWRPSPDFEAMANPSRLLALYYGENKTIKKEEKERLIAKYQKTSFESDKKRRKGQSEYRKELLKKYSNGCPVTGIKRPELLIASHIQPWATCEEEDKTSSNNGFMLSALIDKLFDKGLITITEEGRIIYSPLISDEEQERIGLDTEKQYFKDYLDDKERYLNYHRSIVFKGKYPIE